MIYDLLAPFYDTVNGDIDYSAWADFIEDIIKREYNDKAELILDLGCGTGKMTVELAKRGYDMTGVDYSLEMLDKAKERAEKSNLNDKILWLYQDMTAFELYGTVDVIVSCLDCINHITDIRSLVECFSLAHNYLNPDGLFIFDINGRAKFETVYADNSFVMEEDGRMCVWQNYYNERSKKCDFYITVFNECCDGRYERFDETQSERMYTLRSIKSTLSRCGFEFIEAYSDFDFNTANDENERLYIVARCKK